MTDPERLALIAQLNEAQRNVEQAILADIAEIQRRRRRDDWLVPLKVGLISLAFVGVPAAALITVLWLVIL